MDGVSLMEKPTGDRPIICFGVFELNLDTSELKKRGMRLKLSGQALQILELLVTKPAELVTREELRQKLWPADTFVDFDHGLNTTINRLREILGDSADTPKFIETVPRRGYRFIATIENFRPSTPRPASWGWHLTVLAAGVLLASGLLAYWLRHHQHPHSNALAISPFTTFPGIEVAPSFSPDGSEIVFAWNGGESSGLSFDLYIKQIGSEHLIQLTRQPAIVTAPVWSPDGHSIAFSRVEKDGSSGIYLMSALGGPARKLTDFYRGDEGWPFILFSWSPDGKWLAFAGRDPPGANVAPSAQRSRIRLLNVESTEQHVFPDPSPDCTATLEPAFSPDGKSLASVCMLTTGVNRIYLQPREGGPAREVVLVKGGALSGTLEGITWTADSRSLLYALSGSLWRVPTEGGTPEKLLFAQAQDIQTPVLSRSGSELAFVQARFPPNIWRIELTARTKPAGPASKFISSSIGEQDPRISPDGKHIAFESGRSGNWEIWVCDRDGSNATQLTFFGGPITGTPAWSPDNRRIVFDSRASGHAELYIVSADGGPSQRLITGTANASEPFWSADGRSIYFLTEEPDAIWKVSAEGGTAVRLTKDNRFDPQVSADGTRVFYRVTEGDHHAVWSVPVNGGDERRETGMFSALIGWTPVQGGIYVLAQNAQGPALNFLDFATRRVQKVVDMPDVESLRYGITVSRDGRTLLFSRVDHSEADIMLVEGFR